MLDLKNGLIEILVGSNEALEMIISASSVRFRSLFPVQQEPKSLVDIDIGNPLSGSQHGQSPFWESHTW